MVSKMVVCAHVVVEVVKMVSKEQGNEAVETST